MTQAAHTPFKLTPALINAMVAVRLGQVDRIYRINGNVFHGPRGIASSCYRRLEALRFIEDAPGQSSKGAFEIRVRQQLSGVGKRALREHDL